MLLFLPVAAGFSQEDVPELDLELFPEEEPVEYSLHSNAFGFRVGLFWLGQSESTEIQGVAPSQLVQNGGISFRFPVGAVLALEPGLDLFYREYLFSEDLNRAVPTLMETGRVTGPLAGVLGAVINLPLSVSLNLGSDRFGLVLKPGISAVIRIPLWGIDGTTREETNPILVDLNGNGRFVYPETALGFVLGMGPRTDAEFGLRVLYPLWHLWDDRNLPFWDNLIVWGSVTLRWQVGN